MTQRTFSITWCPDRFLKHSLAHGFCDIFPSKARVQCLYDNSLEWLKITHFLFGKLQTTVVEDIKLEKWYEPSNKSAITGFCTGKNSKFTGSFSWGCFMFYAWFLWCCFWSPFFFQSSVLNGLWFWFDQKWFSSRNF